MTPDKKNNLARANALLASASEAPTRAAAALALRRAQALLRTLRLDVERSEELASELAATLGL
jgi:hypothetical protein